MNPVRMFDRGHALVASQVNNAFGGKAVPDDFCPYGKKKEDDIIDNMSFVDRLSQHKGVKIGR